MMPEASLPWFIAKIPFTAEQPRNKLSVVACFLRMVTEDALVSHCQLHPNELLFFLRLTMLQYPLPGKGQRDGLHLTPSLLDAVFSKGGPLFLSHQFPEVLVNFSFGH